jgi:hypothetical protein
MVPCPGSIAVARLTTFSSTPSFSTSTSRATSSPGYSSISTRVAPPLPRALSTARTAAPVAVPPGPDGAVESEPHADAAVAVARAAKIGMNRIGMRIVASRVVGRSVVRPADDP